MWILYPSPHSTASALSVVVFNLGGNEALALCTARRCAMPRCCNDDNEKENSNRVAFVSSSSDGFQSRVRRLMYGLQTDRLEVTRPPEPQRVRLVASNEEIADALSTADAFVVTANESPVDTDALTSAIPFCDPARLKTVVLMSKQGVVGNEGGSFFGGGGGKNFLKAEDNLRSLLKSQVPDCSLAILRCGVLKGGGPGYSRLGGRVEGLEDEPETGLTSIYYSGNFDLANAMTSISHDRFTLGANLVQGDPNKMPNAFMMAAKKDSVDASPTETNICTAAVVATSLVEIMCTNSDKKGRDDLEISLGCDKSEQLPTVEDIVQEVKALI